MVFRDNPVIDETFETPPHPISRALAAANRLAWTESVPDIAFKNGPYFASSFVIIKTTFYNINLSILFHVNHLDSTEPLERFC
jgi:hypothetical protein